MTSRLPGDLLHAEVGGGEAGVEQHGALRGEPAEHVDLVQQGRVLDDQRVGRGDRLAEADLAVVDPAEGHDRRAGALGPEARERLGVPALEEGGHREQLGGGDDALAAATVDPHGEHAQQRPRRGRACASVRRALHDQ